MVLCKFSQQLLVLILVFFLALPPPAQGLSIGEERMLGEQLLYAVRSRFSLLDDPDITQYINKLGQEVLAVAGPQYFDYHFFVVKDDQFNAFAAPSGLIFFHTGLIKTIRNEDQFMSVMAHEVAHVVSRHISSRIAQQGRLTAASMLFGLASLALGNSALSQGLFTGAMAANVTAGLSFSRQDEEQADRLAFDWMQRMGRDPQAMEEVLKAMRRISRYRSEQLPPYLLTHPNPEDRLHYVRSLLEMERRKGRPAAQEKTDNFAFLRFKYRVLSQALAAQELRIHCTNTLTGGRDAQERTMARYCLALLSAEERNFTEALRHLDAVRKKKPNRDILDIDYAVLLLDAGQHEQALALLRRAYDRDPTNMYATFQLARTLEQQGERTKAEQLYLEVTKVMPEYAQLYFELGRLKSHQGKPGESNFYLAQYYLYQGRMRYARQYLERAQKDMSIPASLREEAQKTLTRLKELEDA
jgi:predicted Zn-dependent protease